MAININGITCNTIEEVEAQIIDLPEAVQQSIRNDFNGIPNVASVISVPFSVSSRQIRLALLFSGIDLTMIDSIINQLPEPTKSAARISWEYSNEMYRTDPMLNGLASQLNLTYEQIDQLFILAETL